MIFHASDLFRVHKPRGVHSRHAGHHLIAIFKEMRDGDERRIRETDAIVGGLILQRPVSGSGAPSVCVIIHRLVFVGGRTKKKNKLLRGLLLVQVAGNSLKWDT